MPSGRNAELHECVVRGLSDGYRVECACGWSTLLPNLDETVYRAVMAQHRQDELGTETA